MTSTSLNTALLQKLIPGDTLLADRGFDISESVGFYCCRLEISAFTKGKRQLEGITVEQTRNIANVRIHVERVIGNVRKKYSIYIFLVPHNQLTLSFLLLVKPKQH